MTDSEIYARKLTRRTCIEIEKDMVKGVREYLIRVNEAIKKEKMKKKR